MERTRYSLACCLCIQSARNIIDILGHYLLVLVFVDLALETVVSLAAIFSEWLPRPYMFWCSVERAPYVLHDYPSLHAWLCHDNQLDPCPSQV